MGGASGRNFPPPPPSRQGDDRGNDRSKARPAIARTIARARLSCAHLPASCRFFPLAASPRASQLEAPRLSLPALLHFVPISQDREREYRDRDRERDHGGRDRRARASSAEPPSASAAAWRCTWRPAPCIAHTLRYDDGSLSTYLAGSARAIGFQSLCCCSCHGQKPACAIVLPLLSPLQGGLQRQGAGLPRRRRPRPQARCPLSRSLAAAPLRQPLLLGCVVDAVHQCCVD